MKKLLFLLFVCSFATRVSSAEELAKPVVPNNRFLFVVENTSAMKRSANAAQQVVRELIENGVQGEMRTGDTFGVWTFDDQLNMTFPVQQWSQAQSKAHAFRAADFLKQHRYENKGKLSVALPKVYSLIKDSKFITVILVTTGTEPIRGTPFDREINTIYPQYSKELRDAKIPFVTILIGYEGRPVAYSVNSSIGPIHIPQPPLKPKTEEAVAPARNAAPAKIEKPDAAAKPTAKPIIITKKEPKSVATNATPAVAPVNISQPIVAPPVFFAGEEKATNASALPKTETTKVTAEIPVTKEVQATPQGTSKVENKIDSAVVNKTEAAALAAGIGENKNASVADVPEASKEIVSAKEVVAPSVPKQETQKQPAETIVAADSVTKVNEPLSPAPVVAVSNTTVGAKKLLVGGFVLLMVAGVLVFVFMRHSRKNQPSLISHSINRNR